MLISALLSLPVYAIVPVEDAANLAQLIDQFKVIQMEIKSLDPSSFHFSDISGLIDQLGNAINQVNSIAYSAQDATDKFQALFPGYSSSTDYTKYYQNSVQSVLATLSGTLNSLHISASDYLNESSRLKLMESAMSNLTDGGQVAVLQANGQIASEMVRQTTLLKQTVQAQTNAELVYEAKQVNDQAAADQEQSQILANSPTTPVPYGSDPLNINANDL